MAYFISHELLPERDGSVLILYLNQNQTEFSDELGTVFEAPGNLQKSIQNYINTNLPTKRVKAVKVMFGTIMVSTLFFNGGEIMAAPVENPQVKVEEKDKSGVYTVQSGETLYSIAKKFSLTVEQLKKLNNLTSDIIAVGQVLTTQNLTAEPTLQDTSSQIQTTSYTVSTGDTLFGIAKRLNVSADQIKQVNNLTTDLIRIGQVLTIPGQSGTTAVDNAQVQVQTSAYTVSPGDTLYVIAKKFNVTIDQIKEVNSLTTDLIRVGQQLKIPLMQGTSNNTVSGTYTAAAGDSLFSIAKKYNATVERIKQMNNLTSDTIKVGQTLLVPSGTISTAVTNDPVMKQLEKLGYLTIQASTGNNNVIINGIIAFQNDYGLPATGVADSATMAEIEHAVVKKALVKDTLNYQGIPYLWGGTTTKGFDCSGFVYFMFKAHNINMARTTSGNLYNMGKTISKDKLQPGDLVFYDVNHTGQISHVGFYVGNNGYISATNSKGIAVNSMDNVYWSKYYVGAKRVY